jgi:hypothetical protein
MSIYRIRRMFYVLILGLLIIAPVSAQAVLLLDGAGVPNGVYCEINKVKLFALSAEDCENAGGKVTHTVKTTVEPVKSEKE